METLRAMMLNILVMIFLTTLLDFLLPEGSLRGYVKMTMGFFVVLTLLQPVMQLANPEAMLVQWQLTMPATATAESLAVDSEVYQEQVQQLEQMYSEKLNEQVRSLLLLTTDLEQVQVESVVEEQCLQQLHVQIPAGTDVDKQRIAQALSGYYGLAVEQITVETEEADADGLEELK